MIRKTPFGIECDQDFNSLGCKDGQKHCELCNKPVYDFTNTPRKEILEHYKTFPQTCGRFNLEQVEPSITTLSSFFQKPRLALAALLLQFGISKAFAQDRVEGPKTELAPTPFSKDYVSAPDNICPAPGYENQPEAVEAKVTTKRKEYIYYMSKRFPFIHKRRLHRYLGCPSF